MIGLFNGVICAKHGCGGRLYRCSYDDVHVYECDGCDRRVRRCDAVIEEDGATLRCLLREDHWPEEHTYHE